MVREREVIFAPLSQQINKKRFAIEPTSLKFKPIGKNKTHSQNTASFYLRFFFEKNLFRWGILFKINCFLGEILLKKIEKFLP